MEGDLVTHRAELLLSVVREKGCRSLWTGYVVGTSAEMGTFWMSSSVTVRRPGSVAGTLIWQCAGCPSKPSAPSTGRGT